MSATRPAQATDGQREQLVLGSELAEMERLPVWVHAIAVAHGIGDTTEFGIQLCLEEVVSNVIRHGYGEVAGRSVSITCESPRAGYFEFTVEDAAAHFNPLERETTPVQEQPEDILGGQGIRLLRGFADSLAYEALPGGNRMTMGFTNK